MCHLTSLKTGNLCCDALSVEILFDERGDDVTGFERITVCAGKGHVLAWECGREFRVWHVWLTGARGYPREISRKIMRNVLEADSP